MLLPLRFRLLFAIVLAGSPLGLARACDFASAPSDRWTLAREDGAAWLKTPCGDRFFSLGVNVLDGGYPDRETGGKVYYSWKAFEPTLESWIDDTRARLLSWGFNSAGGWSLPPQQLQLPEVVDLELGRAAAFHWFDPFAPETESRMMALARELTAPYRGSPYRIGYFSDNEVGWWAGALFVFYSAKPADSFTKQRWVAMLRDHYGEDWSRFAADFIPPAGADSWPALLAAENMTRMRPGGSGIAAVREWTALVAEHYYTLAERAIRAADPDALYFGDRLPIYYDPAAVRAMARHVDAIATNYNPDSGDGWIAPYFFDGLEQLSGGKPVLVSEWFFAARENRTGNSNNGHLMTVQTQDERARGAAAATENFAARPEIVGAHWFQYYDHPKGGRPDGEDYDFGLVDIDNRPYRRLTRALTAANREAAVRHAESASAAAEPTGPPARFALPQAAISVHDKSLSNWPKPASLLPPLTPSPGAVDFGEIYLSWSAQGLALATIGQDYFDIELLAYDGEFPLGEAYRVEFGVDVGSGPRRMTLFFIPPKTKVRDHPPMSALLCAGAAREAIANGCTPVAGAEAVYFGADQPRITAEMVIPWSALGIAPPHPGTPLRAEVAVTSWHRERWMSLSGKPPDSDLADPALWRPMEFGDGARLIERVPRLPGGGPG
ncbi:MAG: hypothetical protein JO267_09005 [Alphaproteobacteria bacterium]|nr:hypothetical protein [Alphaproteobacteria bacterium]